MKKELKEGMGFICETLEEKKRIWQKLTDAGYPMHFDFECASMIVFCIRFIHGAFESSYPNQITHPLNESDFFNDWTPKAGELVEASNCGIDWRERIFMGIWKDTYYCFIEANYGCAWRYKHIRQIKPETMTLQEVREALGKPNLIVTQ
jgi:hypothetical protein